MTSIQDSPRGSKTGEDGAGAPAPSEEDTPATGTGESSPNTSGSKVQDALSRLQARIEKKKQAERRGVSRGARFKPSEAKKLGEMGAAMGKTTSSLIHLLVVSSSPEDYEVGRLLGELDTMAADVELLRGVFAVLRTLPGIPGADDRHKLARRAMQALRPKYDSAIAELEQLIAVRNAATSEGAADEPVDVAMSRLLALLQAHKQVHVRGRLVSVKLKEADAAKLDRYALDSGETPASALRLLVLASITDGATPESLASYADSVGEEHAALSAVLERVKAAWLSDRDDKAEALTESVGEADWTDEELRRIDALLGAPGSD